MTVALNRAYGGYIAGAIAVFDKPTEEALIAQGIAVNSTGVPSGGAQAPQTIMQGRATIPIGANSVAINHPLCTEQSVAFAAVNQAAVDATLLGIDRVLVADGVFTIYGTTGTVATAAVEVNWALFNVVGSIRN